MAQIMYELEYRCDSEDWATNGEQFENKTAAFSVLDHTAPLYPDTEYRVVSVTRKVVKRS